MNLKEAFQLQKRLSALMEIAAGYLDDTDNIMTVTEKHLRSKVVPEQADVSYDCSEKSALGYAPMAVLAAWQALMSEKEALGRAIARAKAGMDFAFDAAIEENRARRRLIRTLQQMVRQRSSGKVLRGAGTGYVFNKEGNQTSYCYDIDEVRTIDYDRTAVRTLLRETVGKAEEVSLMIDHALLSVVVDYEPKLIAGDAALYEHMDGGAAGDASALEEIIGRL